MFVQNDKKKIKWKHIFNCFVEEKRKDWNKLNVKVNFTAKSFCSFEQKKFQTVFVTAETKM